MKDSTKKLLAGIAEAGADYIARQAKHYSKLKTIPEEYRDGFYGLKDSIGDYKENIGSCPDAASESYSPPSVETEICTSAPSDTSIPKTYFDEEKSREQELNATSNDDIGELSVDEWEKRWHNCGKLHDVKLDDIPEDVVGLVRLLYNGELCYLVRSIELGRGGIRRTVAGLMDLSTKKKTLAHRMIKENFNSLILDILPIGGDNAAINVCRNLERTLISKYNPLWM